MRQFGRGQISAPKNRTGGGEACPFERSQLCLERLVCVEYVDILLLLPRMLERAVYVYRVPAGMPEELEFGQRVQVRAGGCRREGIVLGPASGKPPGKCSEIIKALDAEPVISPELLELAEWMALHYGSPLEKVLRGMIPAFLRHRQKEMIRALVFREELDFSEEHGLLPVLDGFMERLWDKGQLGIKEAIDDVGKDGVRWLEDRGWIMRVQEYGFSSRLQPPQVIAPLAGAGAALEDLASRAPRQAEFLSRLLSAGSLNWEEARALAEPRVIKELKRKQLISVTALTPKTQPEPDFSLSPEQLAAITGLQDRLQEGGFKECLLWGVTGSGKTEVYIHLSREVLARGQSVLLLLPEIALTRQLVEAFMARIGDVAIMHSDMPARERYEMWNRIRHGQTRMVIGARSAVFAPLEEPGLIIIDEEQETSYKQEESPRYHVRDVARRRAQTSGAMLLMGSATPSMESFHLAMKGQIGLLELKQRIGDGQEPLVVVDDMRTSPVHYQSQVIGTLLRDKIEQRLAEGEQVILFMNRRGYRPLTLCRSCGRSRSCPHCTVSLNYHRDRKAAVCHYCGYREKPESNCAFCGSPMMDMAGFGTQTIEEESARLFPRARIARLDTDSSQRRGQQEKVLAAMRAGEIDILVGTQMVAKGLDFPLVSLVGVLGADQMLGLPDFRAGERAFQLIVQAAGRAGRARGGAEVVVQTCNPDSPIIRMAVEQDYAAFYISEIRQRQLLQYPPFTHLLRVVATSEDEDLCHRRIADIIEYSGELLDAREEEYVFLGPAECPIYRLRSRYRCQFLVKAANEALLSSLAVYLARLPAIDNCRLELDLNPLNLM